MQSVGFQLVAADRIILAAADNILCRAAGDSNTAACIILNKPLDVSFVGNRAEGRKVVGICGFKGLIVAVSLVSIHLNE